LQVFASALLAGRAKLVGMAPGVRGPFRPNQVKRVDFSGKISYPQCRKAVYAPSGFDVSLAVRSAELPKASLWLEFVYGYK
jgi:microtubule-associated protein-like 6